MGTTGLRNVAIFTFVVSMAILLAGGHFAKDKVPPIPEKVMSAGQEMTSGAAILRGQDVYQRYGLMDHGSVWGHGSLRGMDFSAYTLHCVGALVKQHITTQGKPSADAYQRAAAATASGSGRGRCHGDQGTSPEPLRRKIQDAGTDAGSGLRI